MDDFLDNGLIGNIIVIIDIIVVNINCQKQYDTRRVLIFLRKKLHPVWERKISLANLCWRINYSTGSFALLGFNRLLLR